MDMPEAMATTEEPGGDHARGAVLLSSMRPRRNAVSPYLGVTVDQLIAKKYGRDTILESIQLAVEERWQLRELQLGLQLRLHKFHFVDFAGRAPPDRG